MIAIAGPNAGHYPGEMGRRPTPAISPGVHAEGARFLEKSRGCPYPVVDPIMDFDDFTIPSAQEPPRSPPVPPPPLVPLRQVALAPVLRASPPTAARAKAGLGIVAAAVGTGVGAALGGPAGAMIGLAGVGAVRNLYRAQGIASSDPAEQGDAARSLAICLVGAAIAGYLGYRVFVRKNSDE